MVVSKHLTHFCYPIRLVLHQHLNSLVAYPSISPEIFTRMGVGRHHWSNLSLSVWLLWKIVLGYSQLYTPDENKQVRNMHIAYY